MDQCTLERPPDQELCTSETKALQKCEAIIERGLKTFQEVGAALLEIRDKMLCRRQYATFREYCIGRWGFSDSRARQLIGAAKVCKAVESVTNVTVPNEAIARELNRLPEEQQSGCWQDTVRDCGGVEKVTAAKLKAIVDLWAADNEPHRPDADDHDQDE